MERNRNNIYAMVMDVDVLLLIAGLNVIINAAVVVVVVNLI